MMICPHSPPQLWAYSANHVVDDDARCRCRYPASRAPCCGNRDPSQTQNSPYAAALASFSKVTGTPHRSARRSRSGKLFQPLRFTGLTNMPVGISISPGEPSPTRATSAMVNPALAATFFTARPIRAVPSSTPLRTSVGMLRCASVRPWSSTNPTLMFVPPKSTPTKNGFCTPSSGNQAVSVRHRRTPLCFHQILSSCSTSRTICRNFSIVGQRRPMSGSMQT